MNNRLICIVSQSHLCRNPRVLKEALTLAGAGYKVHILTAVYSAALLNEDYQLIKDQPIIYSFYSQLHQPGLHTLLSRFTRRWAVLIQEKLGLESKHSLGYAAYRLKKCCKKINAGLYIMHQELPTVIGAGLIQKGFNVAFDLEDWYSKDLLPEAQAKRPIKLLQKAESAALQKSSYCTTTSVGLAQQLAETYQGNQPDVVYNAFRAVDGIAEEKVFQQPLKLFWFSQTIGPGRGLEAFILLLKQVPAVLELHLLGNIDSTYKNELIALMPAQHQLIFHSLVTNQELPAKIAEFDIGLALELVSPPSRNYTVTNKFFQCIASGLPVIASQTVGQAEMFTRFKPGIMLPQKPSEEDVSRLIDWLNNHQQLQLARQQALQAARYYSWEQQEQKVLTLVSKALEASR